METNQTEVSAVSAEDKLAAAFEKAGYGGAPEKEESKPESAHSESSDDADSTDDESENETESDSQEQTDDVTPDDASEEVEYEGKSYNLPRELKEALLRTKDYTLKTQEVAQQRRATEERAADVEFRQKFQEAHFAKAVEAQSLNTQLQQYALVDWAGLAESNPSQYLQLDRQHRQLQEAANRVNGEIQHLGQQFVQKMQQDRQKAQARCIEELRKDFKDFGPELIKSLDETGKAFGFSGEELSNVTDPRLIRVLHAATQFRKLQGAKRLVEKKVQDAKPVQAKAARSANTIHANAQLTEARDRLRKTGKVSDAESFLAARFAKAYR